MLPTKDMASPAEIPFTIYGTKINYVPHTVDLFLIQEKTAASSLAASVHIVLQIYLLIKSATFVKIAWKAQVRPSTGVTYESHGFLPVLIFVMNYSVAGF